ncbi:MAG: hypothetical protein ABSG17_11990 [Spirochaetia bacterium]|jgi:hypothetical protein
MKWVKAPEELKGVLAAGMEGIDCEKRLMFGYPAYFINSNMFSGLFQASVFIRLSPAQVASLRKQHPSIAALEPMPSEKESGKEGRTSGVVASQKASEKNRPGRIGAKSNRSSEHQQRIELIAKVQNCLHLYGES